MNVYIYTHTYKKKIWYKKRATKSICGASDTRASVLVCALEYLSMNVQRKNNAHECMHARACRTIRGQTQESQKLCFLRYVSL